MSKNNSNNDGKCLNGKEIQKNQAKIVKYENREKKIVH